MANSSINEIAVQKIETINKKDFGWKDITAPKGENGKAEIIIDGVTTYVKVDAEGKWSFTPPEWAEGMHTVQITIIDEAGNRGPATSSIVNLDTKPPVAPEIWRVADNTGSDKGNLNPGDITDEAQPVLSGVGEPGSTVYIYDNNGTTPIASAKVNGMGAWTVTPDLADGDHSLTATVKDAGKHESPASAAFNLKIEAGIVVMAENSASEVEHHIEPAATTNDFGTFANAFERHQKSNVISISRTADPYDTIEITINNTVTLIETGADGKWSFSSDALPDGVYFFQYRVRDDAGNWGLIPTQMIFHIEAENPEAPQILRVIDDEGQIDHLTSGQYTDDKTPTLSGVAQPGSLVFIYGATATPIGSVTAGNDGRWSFTPTLTTDDTYVFSAAYEDSYGRMSPKSDNFILKLDATAPSAPEISEAFDDFDKTAILHSGDKTDDTTPKLSGVADAGSIVRIWDGNQLIGSTVANSRGQWSYEVDQELAEGSHSLRVDSVSKGGSASAKSDEFILIVDTSSPPPAEISEIVANNGSTERPLVSGDATNDDTPVLRGTGKEGEIVHVYDGDDVINSTVVKADGTWEIELDPLDESSHELKIKIEDPATGKESDFSTPVIIVVDLTPPNKPGVPEIIDNTGGDNGPVQPGTPIDETKPEFKGGGANPGDTVEVVIIDENGDEKVIGTGIVDAGGNWTVTPTDPIDDGEYEVVVDITDPAGNTSDRSDPIDLIIDTQVPDEIVNFELWDDVGIETGVIHEGGFTDDKSPTVRGTGEEGSKVIIWDGNTEIGSAVVTNGEWSYELQDLTEGAHNIRVQPVSASGVPGPINAGINFEVDVTPPGGGSFLDGTFVDKDGFTKPLDLTPRKDGTLTPVNGQVLTLNGSGVEDGTTVVLYGDAARTLVLGSAVVTNGEWKLETIELEERSYDFSFGYRDLAGNETAGSETFTLVIDVTPPGAVDPGDLFPDSVNDILMTMSLNDILGMSDDSLFIDNGKTQLMIADAGKEVALEDILPKGEEVSNWSQANGTVTVAGVEYNVYQNNAGDAEVMVPQHLIQEQH
ncbi:Ig-like domain-containing protein [Pantoea trifolii]|uniref:Ig-like domain-containing protein n=1 Tax=Pantoea trifolii TaxID=2968030 RepID=A0ABT1VQD2_9GAMM|nr:MULTISPECIES: Ig-like domain-containing protein [unclassified Pantoea]MCQ8229052.1 Ig-like domain-containing protein [Pantoea sp. MMK2]MCQ8237226.1 Ig-like domain-containing protein [Pantoea sp. MMK3]